MLNVIRLFATASAVTFLSGCFLSEKSLIGQGEIIHDGPIAFCLDPSEPCHEATVEDGTYLVLPHPEGSEEEPMTVRFRRLMEAGGEPVWLGEADLSEKGEEEEAWAYVVARKLKDTDEGVRQYEVAVPDCGEATDSEKIRYGLEKDGAYACRVTDIGAFAEYLRTHHADEFSDDAWWADAR